VVLNSFKEKTHLNFPLMSWHKLMHLYGNESIRTILSFEIRWRSVWSKKIEQATLDMEMFEDKFAINFGCSYFIYGDYYFLFSLATFCSFNRFWSYCLNWGRTAPKSPAVPKWLSAFCFNIVKLHVSDLPLFMTYGYSQDI